MGSLPPKCPQSKRGDRLYILMSTLTYLVPKKGKKISSLLEEKLWGLYLSLPSHSFPYSTFLFLPVAGGVSLTWEEIIRESYLAAELSHIL
jgi:hypothetical protein